MVSLYTVISGREVIKKTCAVFTQQFPDPQTPPTTAVGG